MRGKRKFLVVTLFAFLFLGCELETGENFHFVNLEVANVVFPENFTMGETHEILVSYRRPDDCYFFEGFEVLTADETTRNVVVIGSVMTEEECTMTNDEVEATLLFSRSYLNKPIYSVFIADKTKTGSQHILNTK